MAPIESEGRTVAEAVEAALLKSGLRRDQVEITVTDEGSTGFMGLGAKPAKVRLTEKRWGPDSPAPSPTARTPQRAPARNPRHVNIVRPLSLDRHVSCGSVRHQDTRFETLAAVQACRHPHLTAAVGDVDVAIRRGSDIFRRIRLVDGDRARNIIHRDSGIQSRQQRPIFQTFNHINHPATIVHRSALPTRSSRCESVRLPLSAEGFQDSTDHHTAKLGKPHLTNPSDESGTSCISVSTSSSA